MARPFFSGPQTDRQWNLQKLWLNLGNPASLSNPILSLSQGLSLAPDIPTLKEQGINVVFQQFRSIAAPKDISAEAVKYYEEVFKKLSESKIWKDRYIRENMLTPDYTTSAGTYKLWEAQSNMYAQIMKEMGIIK